MIRLRETAALMGIPISFQDVLEGKVVEDERLEFKETWDPQASLKTICAFANDLNNWGGGYIVIGVRESGDGSRELVGVSSGVADSWLKDILNKSKLVQPDYCPVSEVVSYEGKLFIVLWCPGGSTRPYSSPKTMGKKSDRIHWVRRLSSTVIPSIDEERDLYTLANNVPFDDRPNHEANLDDLNPALVRSYLKDVKSSLYDVVDQVSFEELCRDMHIAVGPPENLRPVNVGLMFFSNDPRKHFPYAQIDVVEFPDGEGGNTLVEHVFVGPLHQQLEDTLRYLSNNVVAEYVIKQSDGSPSVRYFNYPLEALKEALANAVYHKGYDLREPIEVRVLPDRIEILSHPGADRSISLEGLKNYRMACRHYRNRRIGEFLKELGLTEGRNTGVHKILRALRENGSPDPLFETDENRLYFMVTVFSRPAEQKIEECSELLVIESSEELGYRSADDRRRAVLEYFRLHPTSTLATASESLTIAIATLNRDIAHLREEKLMWRESARRWHVES